MSFHGPVNPLRPSMVWEDAIDTMSLYSDMAAETIKLEVDRAMVKELMKPWCDNYTDSQLESLYL